MRLSGIETLISAVSAPYLSPELVRFQAGVGPGGDQQVLDPQHDLQAGLVGLRGNMRAWRGVRHLAGPGQHLPLALHQGVQEELEGLGGAPRLGQALRALPGGWAACKRLSGTL